MLERLRKVSENSVLGRGLVCVGVSLAITLPPSINYVRSLDLRSQVDEQSVACPDPQSLPSYTKQLDALVVLGSGTDEDNLDSFGKVRTKATLIAAKRQLENFGRVPLIIPSGATTSQPGSSMTEMIMRFAQTQPEWEELSTAAGFRIIADRSSIDTATNMLNSATIAKGLGVQVVGVVSNGQHALSAAMLGRVNGVETVPVVAEAEIKAESCKDYAQFQCGFETAGMRRVEFFRQVWMSYDFAGRLLTAFKTWGLQTEKVKRAVAAIGTLVQPQINIDRSLKSIC